jgi:hypothetical protein
MVIEWLLPLSLFFIGVALYLGGLNVAIDGGTGTRQVLGFVTTLVLYLVFWRLVRFGLGAAGLGLVPQELASTAIALASLPLLARAGFRVFGVRVHRGSGPAAAH